MFFTSTEAVGLLGTGAQEVLLDFHTAPELCVSIIIIMCIYHALINALSSHMIHINLNMIFYTHVEHSPTKTIYIKYYITDPFIYSLSVTDPLTCCL